MKYAPPTTIPSLDLPPLPRRPYFHPNPGAAWSHTFPSLCIASSIQMSHVGQTAPLQAVYIHRTSERILLRVQDKLVLRPRASRMYQSLVAWLYQAHNAHIIVQHHMAQLYTVHYMQICALNCP